jgi:hypothetical protein
MGYFAAIGALLGLQAMPAFVPALTESGVLLGVWLAVWQLAKAVPTAWRLRDGGYQTGMALLLVLLPVVNLAVLPRFCFGPTPSEELRERRASAWKDQPDATSILASGARIALGSAAIGGTAAIVFGVGRGASSWFLGALMADYIAMEGPQRALVGQVVWGVVLLLGMYSVVNFMKRETASRASWFPVLFLLPLTLFGVADKVGLTARASAQENLALVAVALPPLAWDLLYVSIFGATLAVIWVRLAAAIHQGERVSASEVVGEAFRRTVEISGPHGGRTQIVAIGMQVVLPGIFYALQYAFVDAIAVLEPKRRSLQWSGKVSWGMRTVIFQVLFVGFVVGQLVYLGIIYTFDGGEGLGLIVVNPASLPLATQIASAVGLALVGWVVESALVVLYLQRIDTIRKRKQALQDAKDESPEGQEV